MLQFGCGKEVGKMDQEQEMIEIDDGLFIPVKELERDIEQAWQDLREGRALSHEEVWDILSKEYGL